MHLAKYAALAAALTIGASASAQSLVGEWVATAKTPQGDFSERLIVSEAGDGYAIAVQQVTELPPGIPVAGPGVDIVLDGDKFSYKRMVALPDGSLIVFYDGIVHGDSFAGQIEIDGLPGLTEYQGVRVKPAAQ